MTLTEIDFIYLGILGLALIVGFFRGLAREAGSFFQLVISIGAALFLYGHLLELILLKTRLTSTAAAGWIAFAATWIAAVIVLRLLGIMFGMIFSPEFGKGARHFGGALFGVLRVGFILCLFLLLVSLNSWTFLRTHCLHDSSLGSWFDQEATPRYRELAEAFPAMNLPNPAPPAPGEPVRGREPAPLDTP